jgi:hypothetical protein
MIEDLYKHKKSLELTWEQEHLKEGRYTLNMVRIDDKIREVITAIKLEEAKIADRENAILNSAPEVSVAT